MDLTVMVGGKPRWAGRLEPRQRRSIVLGTEPGCDVVLGGAGIMPRHAEIGVDETGPWLCAHASLTLDEQVVAGWALLGNGARMMVGEHEVVLEVRAPAGAPLAAIPAEAARPHPPAPAVTTGDEQASVARLGELFALPPPEAAAAAPKDVTPLLKKRFLTIPVRSWILAAVCGVMGLFFLTTRQGPPASAGRSVAPPMVRAVPGNNGLRQPGPQPRSGRPVTSGEVRAAADHVFAGDNDAALASYRALAERDPRFAPFVRALEQRMRKKCTPGISGGGQECP